MKATILIDNKAPNNLVCEWGLSVLIEHRGHLTLLDAGDSGVLVENAQALGADLARVECAALSHAHYDHADGFDAFFQVNSTAKLYIAEAAQENCYGIDQGEMVYMGVAPGMFTRHANRIVRVSRPTEIAPDVWALPHSTAGLAQKGVEARMYVAPDQSNLDSALVSTAQASATLPNNCADATAGESNLCETHARIRSSVPVPAEDELVPDDFSHEQSLIVKLDDGIAVFSSCSHCGPDVAIAEAQAFMPDERIHALVGGFHLYETPDDEVRALAGRLKAAGIERIYTGHCTGDRALAILREELGESMVSETAGGLVIELA